MVTIDHLCDYLDEGHLHYLCDGVRGHFVIPFSGTQVNARIVENGEALLVYVPALFFLDEVTCHQATVLRMIAVLNHGLKIGTFGVDPDDEEIIVSHFVPIEDGTLSAQQFKRVVGGVCHAAQVYSGLLRWLAYRGDGGLAPKELIERAQRRWQRRRLRLKTAHCDPRMAEPPAGLRAMFEELQEEAERIEQSPPLATDEPQPNPAETDAPSDQKGDDHE